MQACMLLTAAHAKESTTRFLQIVTKILGPTHWLLQKSILHSQAIRSYL